MNKINTVISLVSLTYLDLILNAWKTNLCYVEIIFPHTHSVKYSSKLMMSVFESVCSQ